MSKYLSIVTLNENGLNSSIKRHRVAEWIRKDDPHICCLQDTHLRKKELHRLKVKGWKKIYSKRMYRKKSSGSNTYIRQNDFKTKAIKKRHRRTLHNTQGKNPSEDVNIINIYAPNIGAPKYIRKILEYFKKDIDSNTLTLGDFNTPRSKMDRSSKQNTNKDIVASNNALDQKDLTDIYIEPFIPKKQNIHSFQTHMEHFQRQST